jgi:hypothetical protein
MNSTARQDSRCLREKRPRPSKQEINRVATERNGLATVEAEHFSAQEKTGKRQWQLVNNEAPAATARGKAYLKALPDTRVTHDDKLTHGENFSNKPGEMSVVPTMPGRTSPQANHIVIALGF